MPTKGSIGICRYELWCTAKAAKTRYCCIHCDLPVEECRNWNDSREDEKYNSEVFEDLAGRLEVPETRNRWDTPLFRIKPGSDSESQASIQSIRIPSADHCGHKN